MTTSGSIDALVSKMIHVVEARLEHNPQPNTALAHLRMALQECQADPTPANIISVIGSSWLVTEYATEKDQDWIDHMSSFCCALAEGAGLTYRAKDVRR